MLAYYSGFGQWCEGHVDPNEAFSIGKFKPLSDIHEIAGIFELPPQCQKDIRYKGTTHYSYLLPCGSHSDGITPPKSYTSETIVFVLHQLNDDGIAERFSAKEAKFTKTDIIPAEENMSPEVEDTSDRVVKPPHGNSEINAANREEILGAALSVMSAFTDKCKTSGKFTGTKIATLIADKYALFWPDLETGEPPLGYDASTRLINKWLNKTKK